MANQIRYEIRDLQLNQKSVFMIVLIIAKGDRSAFKSDTKKSALTLTVRDSKDHFINCSLWGSDQYITKVDSSYNIGDIVEIIKPVVVQANDDNKYMPRTTSPFLLRLDEKKSFIYRRHDRDYPALGQLKHLTLKSTSLALNLSDVCDQLIGQKSLHCDLLVVVQAVDTARVLNTKYGQRQMRRIHLFDQTADSMPLVLWSQCYRDMSERWQPMETILHFTDVRVEYSEYDRRNILAMDFQTIVIENPTNSHRTRDLLAYAHNHKTLHFISKRSTESTESIEQITEVATVRKILEQLASGANSVAVVIYSILSKFEIDPRYGASPVVKCCAKCNRYLSRMEMQCTEMECMAKQVGIIERFRILTWISDHTGTLKCRINDDFATNILKYDATAFKQLPESAIDHIKKRYSLHRFAVKVIAKPKQDSDYTATIVGITSQAASQVAANIRTY